MAKDEKDDSFARVEVPQRDPLAAVLLWDWPLLKHLVAADEAENGCFLLISTL